MTRWGKLSASQSIDKIEPGDKYMGLIKNSIEYYERY